MLFAGIFNKMNRLTDVAVTQNVESLTAFLAPVFNSMPVIYIAWHGCQMMTGQPLQ